MPNGLDRRVAQCGLNKGYQHRAVSMGGLRLKRLGALGLLFMLRKRIRGSAIYLDFNTAPIVFKLLNQTDSHCRRSRDRTAWRHARGFPFHKTVALSTNASVRERQGS
jgi:hypothetical protein